MEFLEQLKGFLCFSKFGSVEGLSNFTIQSEFGRLEALLLDLGAELETALVKHLSNRNIYSSIFSH